MKATIFTLLLIFEWVKHACNSGVITNCVITFCVKTVIIFWAGKLLHFASITLLLFALILLHFALVLHFAVIITFCGVTSANTKHMQISSHAFLSVNQMQ